MKRIFLLFLALACAHAQNNARMITGVNSITSPSYQFVAQDATRLTTFASATGVSATLVSGLAQGFTVGAMFSVQNLGPGVATINCSGCLFFSTSSGSSIFTLAQGAGADIYSAGLNYYLQTGSGSGGGGGGTCTAFGRSCPISALATDYGSVGIQQVGVGPMNIQTNAGGTLNLGNGSNTIVVSPTSSNNGMAFIDRFGNGIGLNGNGAVGSGGNYIQITTGPSIGTAATMNLSGGGGGEAQWTIGVSEVMSLTPALVEMDQTVDFGDTGLPFTIAGSPGLNGQVPCSTGTTVAWSSSCGAVSGITAVTGTANQILSSGGSSPQFSLAGSLGAPLLFPANVSGTQFANGDDFLTCMRKTDSSPTGNCFVVKSAGGTILGRGDVLGNLIFQSLTTNSGGAGYTAYAAGADNDAVCKAALTALSLNGVCEEGPATIATTWTEVRASAGPAAKSIKTYSTLSSAKTTESFTPTTGTAANIQSADGTVAGAASGVIITADGSGNTHSSGIPVSSVSATCATATITVPVICGSVNSTAISANVGATNIISLTVPAGMYQINTYMNGTTACATPGPGQFVSKIAYSDSNGAVTRSIGTLTFAALPQQQPATATFWNQSATGTLNVSGTYTACTTGTFVLDVHWVLIRLS